VKRYEMYLCATVSLLFCMLPKVVISHEEKRSTLAPMNVQDARSPRSLAENKMSDVSDRDGFILEATSGPFRGSRICESRIFTRVVTLFNIGARANDTSLSPTWRL